MRLGASRFVCGERIEDCLTVIKDLNRRGLKANATVLGEAVASPGEADSAVEEYTTLIERLSAEGLDANPSVKLSLLGLNLGRDVARANLDRVMAIAGPRRMFVRLDMEGSATVDATLEIYRALRERGDQNIGIVLQSYLYRSQADLEALLPLAPNIRIVKGAYLEPPSAAHTSKTAVDRAYVRLMERALIGDGYTAIATHDERLIEGAIRFTRERGIPRDRFEFQMMYGIRSNLHTDLVARGYRVLVATCFGANWYPFFMRRLAERPANVIFLLRNMVR